jgi:hypothetical protein
MPTIGATGGFAINKPRVANAAVPVITYSQGTATTGVVLSVANTGIWVGLNKTCSGSASVQWYRGTATISGGTNATYAVTNSDTGGTAVTAALWGSNQWGVGSNKAARITIS